MCKLALTLLTLLAFDRHFVLADDEKEKTPEASPLFNGKNLSGWRVIDTAYFEKHGKVEVIKGEIVLEKGRPASGIAYTKKPPRRNYELSLDAKRIEGSDFFCGLTFPVGKEYCTLIIGGWGGGTTGLSNIDDTSAVENETTGYTEFKQDRWYTIRLRVTNSTIAVWIDKDQILDTKTEGRKFSIWWEQEPARPLGIVTWNSKAALRNVTLRQLDGNPH